MEPFNLKNVEQAASLLSDVTSKTPLILNVQKSNEFDANIYFKREDLQQVRSYKIRGAYNKISHLNQTQKSEGIVCASAGNHAQGVAYSCQVLQIQGKIYMPKTTPKQKIKQVQLFGKSFDEQTLLNIAYSIEQQVNFKSQVKDWWM